MNACVPRAVRVSRQKSTADAALPRLFSVSYGEMECTVTPAYRDRVDAELQVTYLVPYSICIECGTK